VESQNRIGIYLRKDRATVVCLASQGREKKLLGCFSIVNDEASEDLGQQTLADRIAQECKQRRFKFAETSVALDCALFMQHRVHSDFADPRKIAATVRFDTEEALATDVSDMAVAFRVASTGGDGSTLDVFTAQRSVLSDILLSLQSNGIDPTTVDPDISCLSRYLRECGPSQNGQTSGTLYALLSDSRGYLVGLSPSSGDAVTVRAFLVGPAQDRTALLARETLVTAALAETASPMSKICVSDTSDRLDPQGLGQRVTLEVQSCDPTEMAGIERSQIADCPNAVDFAVAYGAALSPSSNDANVNFRNDHMPYLGKKMRVQKAVRFLSISVAILLLAVGVYFQTQLMRVNRQRAALKAKLEPDYLAVMLNKSRLPATMAEVVRDVQGELRRVTRGKSGEWTDQTSPPAKLEHILKALNGCARQADLNVRSITIGKAIIINADTADRSSHRTVLDALEKTGLGTPSGGASEKDGRLIFTATLDPSKAVQ
jgi:hypothetical protein